MQFPFIPKYPFFLRSNHQVKEAAREAINKVGSIISSDLVQILWILDVPEMKSKNMEKPE